MNAMNKILYNQKKFRTFFIAGVLCGILLACLELTVVDKMPLEDAYLCARDGHVDLSYKVYNADVFHCFLNIIIIIPFINQVFNSDYEIAKAFVFIRIKSISQWYRYKVIQSMVYCLFYSAVYNITLLLMCILMGFKTDKTFLIIGYLIFGIITGFLILFTIIMVNNILSVKIKPHFSTALIMCLTIVGTIITMYLDYSQIQFSLFGNYFISLHTSLSTNSAYYYYPTWVYYAVMSTTILIEILIGNQVMKKADHI